MVAGVAVEAEFDDGVVGVAPEAMERLAAYFGDVTAGLGRPEQRANALVYARGLMQAGARKSLEPIVDRLGGSGAEYQSLQNFLADSPWDPAVVDRAVAERVCRVIVPEAWVLDDTGIVKDGRHSPGVKRQYSGTLGKTGNCQVTVSLHAVGAKGTVALGFRLYLPEEWCDDLPRRRKAKIPDGIEFETKPQIGGDLVARAAGWRVRRAPVLGDQAYGDDATLRARLHEDGIDYVLSVASVCGVYTAETAFAVPERKPGSRGPAPRLARPDREPASIADFVTGLPEHAWQSVRFRDRDGRQLRSRFAFVRVIAAHPVDRLRHTPREEWLIAEWPAGHQAPSDYWLSNLPAATEPERLARLARLRWMIELDYKQLKGQLGLDHYEGRSYPGFHHHCTIVTAAHGFLTLERADPNHQRPG
jgi:SRSO17 transposase